jgi:small subunit ribosomal protein S25e
LFLIQENIYSLITGTCTNWRQEAKEEVVKGQGYVIPHRTQLSTFPKHKAFASSLNGDPRPSRNTPRSLRTLSASVATNSHTVKDKANHAVVLDKQTNDKLQKDVQSYRLITVATLVDRLKINGSLARQALADLEANGQIKKVVGHSKLSIYSMSYHEFCV